MSASVGVIGKFICQISFDFLVLSINLPCAKKKSNFLYQEVHLEGNKLVTEPNNFFFAESQDPTEMG